MAQSVSNAVTRSSSRARSEAPHSTIVPPLVATSFHKRTISDRNTDPKNSRRLHQLPLQRFDLSRREDHPHVAVTLQTKRISLFVFHKLCTRTTERAAAHRTA